jgi:hypothetical protein
VSTCKRRFSRGTEGTSTRTGLSARREDSTRYFASLFAGNKLNVVALCDYGKGDKSKVERLRQSQILKTGSVFPAADFSGKAESDIEDLFNAELYCTLVSQSSGLTKMHQVTPKAATRADPNTERLVKQVQAACRTLPPKAADFGHFVPVNWLLRHPELLEKTQNQSMNPWIISKKLSRRSASC